MKRPMVVTGSHRSGTTWVGRMLCLSGEAGYIHEPLNPVRRPSWMRVPPAYWYAYVTPETEALYRADLERVMGFRYPVLRNVLRLRRPEHVGMFTSDVARSLVPRFRGARPLLKDPFALFATEWLHESFDADIVVTVRSPVAFVGSIKRLNWQFKFKTLLAQDRLLRDWLAPFEGEMRRCRDTDADVVDQGIVLWNALHSAIAELRHRHPEWSFVRHEDLAADPVARFDELYRACGLRWGEDVVRSIQRFAATGGRDRELPMWRHGSVKRDSRAATETWRNRLTEDEVERVRKGTQEVAALFYETA